jgi:hypothetical protein
LNINNIFDPALGAILLITIKYILKPVEEGLGIYVLKEVLTNEGS